jgi:hypothetical protein
MIKYVNYSSHDEYGQHIFPISDLYQLNKTAGSGYSPELLKAIMSIQKKPSLYYVVINAMGSYEVWGDNGNGDAFPEAGLVHKSLRTDMLTKEDYGYKTFEYYAHFFKHHVNKPDSPRYGEVVFSHWNDKIHRVELVVGIDKEKSSEIIIALEKGDPVAVSIGVKVPYDRCCICGNKAKTRKEYCKHAKGYMGMIIDNSLARQWSIELGKTILPGSKVFVFNDYPRGFDISHVYVGADKTSFILTKAASSGVVTLSVDIADAMGITDAMVDKMAYVSKTGEMDKEISADGPSDIDGLMAPTSKSIIIRKALREKLNKLIEAEPEIPAETLNSMASTVPVKNILSTMVGMGIHPKPREFQRIILVSIGKGDDADRFDRDNVVFDQSENCGCMQPDISTPNFMDGIGKILLPFLFSRSGYTVDSREGPSPTSSAGGIVEVSKTASSADLDQIAAMYAGLKMKANGYTLSQIGEVLSKPWLSALIGGGIMYRIIQSLREKESPMINTPASKYEGLLDGADFSGHIKQAGATAQRLAGDLLIGGALAVPATYGAMAYNQRSIKRTGQPFFNTKVVAPLSAAIPVAGLEVANLIFK